VAAPAKGIIEGQAISPHWQIAMHLALHEIELHWVWIPTKENAAAATLSGCDVEKIANICPNLHQKQWQTTHQTPAMRIATCPPRPHDISGGD